jgi:hypothetical protein
VLLKVKYGYTSERAREKISKRIAEYEATPSKRELIGDSLVRHTRCLDSAKRSASPDKKVQPVLQWFQEQGDKMGRKGVSKRKPKKSKSFSNDNGSSKTRPGQSPSVQSLVKDKDAPFNRASTNPSTGSNKKNRKGN